MFLIKSVWDGRTTSGEAVGEGRLIVYGGQDGLWEDAPEKVNNPFNTRAQAEWVLSGIPKPVALTIIRSVIEVPS